MMGSRYSRHSASCAACSALVSQFFLRESWCDPLGGFTTSGGRVMGIRAFPDFRLTLPALLSIGDCPHSGRRASGALLRTLLMRIGTSQSMQFPSAGGQVNETS